MRIIAWICTIYDRDTHIRVVVKTTKQIIETKKNTKQQQQQQQQQRSFHLLFLLLRFRIVNRGNVSIESIVLGIPNWSTRLRTAYNTVALVTLYFMLYASATHIPHLI